jgi:pyruvate kinase
VRPGDRLLLSDGLIELRVEGTDGIEIQTTVVEAASSASSKGINAPGVSCRLPRLRRRTSRT